MRKGEMTRAYVLERAAALFNRKGYSGSSLSDIMRATGLEKGGIYNHFSSKEELALEAFEHAAARVNRRFDAALEGKENAVDRLLAIISAFASYAKDPPVPGGCPILNTAIESDDAIPRLRQRVRDVVDGWQDEIRRTVRQGIRRGEIRPDTEPEMLATTMIATLEGAVMMMNLYRARAHLRRASRHLTAVIHEIAV